MPTVLDNVGSSARDFCMLERNFLSHVKLALLLFVLTTSVLLSVRLPGPLAQGDSGSDVTKLSTPLGSIEAVATVLVILAGVGEYEMGFRDMRMMKSTMASTKPHLGVMILVSLVVFVTCIVLLAQGDQIGITQS
ncbi:hypothetical protein OF83DRAFT_31594 [Amylostereum chailletii]|nr:hypothetical protein OF83DRAFT_31594 [Amylostereum chailletii]